MTPEIVHHGRAEQVISVCQEALDEAYRRHPGRFVRKPPTASQLPTAVWINPPQDVDSTQDLLSNLEMELSQYG